MDFIAFGSFAVNVCRNCDAPPIGRPQELRVIKSPGWQELMRHLHMTNVGQQAAKSRPSCLEKAFSIPDIQVRLIEGQTINPGVINGRIAACCRRTDSRRSGRCVGLGIRKKPSPSSSTACLLRWPIKRPRSSPRSRVLYFWTELIGPRIRRYPQLMFVVYAIEGHCHPRTKSNWPFAWDPARPSCPSMPAITRCWTDRRRSRLC